MKKSNSIDLGFTPNNGMVSPRSESKGKKDKPKVDYPTLVIVDKPEVVECCKMGQTITATVTLKCTGMNQKDPASKNEWEDAHRAEFDVLSIEMETPEEETKEMGEEKANFSELGGKGVDKD